MAGPPTIDVVHGIAVLCYVVIGFSLFNLLALRFAGHPLADAWLALLNPVPA